MHKPALPVVGDDARLCSHERRHTSWSVDRCCSLSEPFQPPPGSSDYDAVSSSQTNAVSEKVAIDSGIQESFKTRAIPLQKLLH